MVDYGYKTSVKYGLNNSGTDCRQTSDTITYSYLFTRLTSMKYLIKETIHLSESPFTYKRWYCTVPYTINSWIWRSYHKFTTTVAWITNVNNNLMHDVTTYQLNLIKCPKQFLTTSYPVRLVNKGVLFDTNILLVWCIDINPRLSEINSKPIQFPITSKLKYKLNTPESYQIFELILRLSKKVYKRQHMSPLWNPSLFMYILLK